MRIILNEYANGGRTALELSDDGGTVRGKWAGQYQVGERICAFLDAGCESTEAGVERLLESMAWLMEESRKRKAQVIAAEANGPLRASS